MTPAPPTHPLPAARGPRFRLSSPRVGPAPLPRAPKWPGARQPGKTVQVAVGSPPAGSPSVLPNDFRFGPSTWTLRLPGKAASDQRRRLSFSAAAAPLPRPSAPRSSLSSLGPAGSSLHGGGPLLPAHGFLFRGGRAVGGSAGAHFSAVTEPPRGSRATSRASAPTSVLCRHGPSAAREPPASPARRWWRR